MTGTFSTYSNKCRSGVDKLIVIEDRAAMFTKAFINLLKLALSFSDVLYSAFLALNKVYKVFRFTT